jgi:large conductance mechanosensitive channel
MIKGFKEFVLRGNVLELAIAVVIGTAFTKVVDSFVSAIITPILNALPGASIDGFGFALRHGALRAKTTINFATIINSLLVFLMTAAVVYFLFVVPMTKFEQRRAKGLVPQPAAVDESTLLLREIRDSLRASQTDGRSGTTDGVAAASQLQPPTEAR